MGAPAVQPLQAVADNRHAVRSTARTTRERGNVTGELVLGTTVMRYLTSIFPLVRRELAHWQRRARTIPDPVLRADAIASLSKRGNVEGAALFAVLAPRSHRRATVQALVAFQAAYNYLDTLAEQVSADPIANGRQLHQALLVALDPGAGQPDHYALHPQRDDGGFLAALVDACSTALTTLPSYAAVSAVCSTAAARIVTFQSLNLTERQGGHEALERWARQRAAEGSPLDWWQAAAAEGSSLAVHALIATAANPDVRLRDVEAIDAAYFPWICALHSLLDSLVDVAEDERAGQRNLLSYHASTAQAALAMGFLAQRATDAIRDLPDVRQHQVILSAMVGYYLSSPEASTPYARAVGASVAGAVGPLLPSALALFKVRRALTRAKGGRHW